MEERERREEILYTNRFPNVPVRQKFMEGPGQDLNTWPNHLTSHQSGPHISYYT